MIKTCERCGKEFKTTRKSSRYCSRKCYCPPLIKKCPRCGKNFRTKPGINSSYCSMACYKPPVIKQCAQCGKSINIVPNRVRENNFCDKACYDRFRTGKTRGISTKVMVICEWCGKSFLVYPSRFTHDPPRFCGDDCFYKWLTVFERAEYIDTACQKCGKPIHKLKSNCGGGRGKFCSHECANSSHEHKKTKPRIERACKHCGKTFQILECQTYGGRGVFCSRQCHGANTMRTQRLKKGPTGIEKLLIDEFALRHIAVEYQYRLTGFTLDFAIPPRKVAIEADGTYWHSLPNVIEKDARKDASLIEQGWTILHFTEDEINASVSACVDQIVTHLT